MKDLSIPISRDEAVLILGPGERNIESLEEWFGVRITSRGSALKVSLQNSAQEKSIGKKIEQLRLLAGRGQVLTEGDIRRLMDAPDSRTARPSQASVSSMLGAPVIVSGRRESIRPKTEGQLRLFEALAKNDVLFAIGPAGTGKTFIAVAAAVRALESGEVDRIIVTRPAIEAGESLGFLPGDLREKIDPYLRPIHDALSAILSPEKLHAYMKSGSIEIAPIAYMRGRTLSNAYAILDEAQNCTVGQMKMFLTRLGLNAKAVITGDITQIDLRQGVSSGLVEIQKILLNVEGVAFCYFDGRDVVRHALVKKIITAYENYETRGRKDQRGDPQQAKSQKEGVRESFEGE